MHCLCYFFDITAKKSSFYLVCLFSRHGGLIYVLFHCLYDFLQTFIGAISVIEGYFRDCCRLLFIVLCL